MILVDSSIWIDHFRSGDGAMAELLNHGSVLTHPYIIGELALGNFRQRAVVLEALRSLPQAVAATDEEVLAFIERWKLFGLGIGYIDAHLLASVELTPGASLLTGDKRLATAAERLSRRH